MSTIAKNKKNNVSALNEGGNVFLIIDRANQYFKLLR